MLRQLLRLNREQRASSRTLRQLGGWMMVSILAAEIAGCGMGGSSGTTAAPEGSALPAGTANTGDEPAARANENPGIMVTPAGGGGIVVGDPLEGGKGAVAAPSVAQATSPTGEAEQPAAAPVNPARRKRDRYEDDGEAEVAAAPAATPAPEAAPRAFGELEGGDEPPPPNARPNGQPAQPAAVGAIADERGALGQPNAGFQSKREEAEADAARTAAAAAAEDGRVEDVDAPPRTAQNNPNAAIERGFGGRDRDKGNEDGDEQFTRGVAPGQPVGEVEIKRGSADEVTETFFSLVAAGQTDKLAPLIAGRATGLLGKLRDGTATPEEIDELKGLAQIRQQENSRPKGGTHRLITFRADKKMLIVEAEQKEENCCVVKLDVRDAPRRRK